MLPAVFASLGAQTETAGTILEKRVLKKIKFQSYQTFGFLAITLVILPFLFFGFWQVSPEAWQFNNLIILGFVIIISTIANYLTFVGLNRENLTEFEPLRLFQPLFVILLAFLFYVSERTTSLNILIPALIASSALIFSHINKHHLKFNKYALATLFGSLFFAIELVASKSILPYYDPLSFYLVRCFFVFLFSWMLFRSKLSSTKGLKMQIILIAAIWVAYRFLLYTGYGLYNIIFTTLMFILAPVLIYLSAIIFLKERPAWKNTVAAIVILICVGYAIFTSSTF